jgi:hypothetical protein
VLTARYLNRLKDTELEWVPQAFKLCVPKIRKLMTPFNEIAGEIAKYGAIDGVAELAIEKRGRGKRVTWLWPEMWLPQFQPPPTAIPSNRVTTVRDDGGAAHEATVVRGARLLKGISLHMITNCSAPHGSTAGGSARRDSAAVINGNSQLM